MKFKFEAAVILLGAIAMAFILGAATQERIRWHLDNYPVYQCSWTNGHRIDFGLRNDGVVVWREIMPATTNSPAEQAEAITNTVMTNGIIQMDNITNFFRPDWTNILIKPLYFHHRGPHGEWTNWEEGSRWWSNQVKPLLD